MQTETQKRKVNDRLYPTPRQAEALGILLRSHQQLYNAALEERISAWKKARQSISYAHQCASLTEIRRDLPEWPKRIAPASKWLCMSSCANSFLV